KAGPLLSLPAGHRVLCALKDVGCAICGSGKIESYQVQKLIMNYVLATYGGIALLVLCFKFSCESNISGL
uniref:Uncharacterized protein n=1 Tax=Oryctolagus cuniculus TaxID=9986 RepID=A0A5F9DHV0_RABIT